MDEPAKLYDLIFEERDGYLYTRVEADTITEEIAMGYLREVAERCSRIECKRLMIHREIPAMLPDGALFFVAADLQKMISGIKTAFVNPYVSNDKSLDFAMTVGINRGANYATFNNTSDAEAWLLK